MADFWKGFAAGAAPAFQERYAISYQAMREQMKDRADQKAARDALDAFEKQRLTMKGGLDIATENLKNLSQRFQIEQDPAKQEQLSRELELAMREYPLLKTEYHSGITELAISQLGRAAGNPHAERALQTILTANDRELTGWLEGLQRSQAAVEEQRAQMAAIRGQGEEQRKGIAASGEQERETQRVRLSAESQERALAEGAATDLATHESMLRREEMGEEARLKTELIKQSPADQLKALEAGLGLMNTLAEMGIDEEAQRQVFDSVPAFKDVGLDMSTLRDRLAGYDDQMRTTIASTEAKIKSLENEKTPRSITLAGKLRKKLARLKDRQNSLLERQLEWEERLEGAGTLEAIGLNISRFFGGSPEGSAAANALRALSEGGPKFPGGTEGAEVPAVK